MAPSPEMQTYAGRLASFDGPKQINKRRASSSKKKQPTTSSWPHQNPSPEQLAKAGFFYKPSSSSPDSVTCFLCSKALDGWDADDDPAVEHLNHVPDCGWAVNCCIEQRIQDMDRTEEDPLSEKMVEARRVTYSTWWPHESKKGWKCKTKKMVDAGWCYTPIPEADDCVTCFYCGASLEGWEPKDDPWQEHRKRAPDCHFFTLVEESTQLKKTTKPKKGRRSRTSKASRQSAQSTTTIGADDSLVQLDNEPTTEEGDSLLSNATTTSKAARSRKKAPRTKAANARGKKGGQSVAEHVNDSLISQQLEAELDDEVAEQETNHEPASQQPQQTKGRKTKRNTAQRSSADAQPQLNVMEARSLRGKKGAAAHTSTAETSNELGSISDVPKEPPEGNRKGPRGRKRMSDGSAKENTDSINIFEPPPKSNKVGEQDPVASSEPPSKRIPHKTTERLESPLSPTQVNEDTVRTAASQQQREDSGDGDYEKGGGEPSMTSNVSPFQQHEALSIHEDVHDEQAAIPPQQISEEPRQQATPPPGDGERRDASTTPQSSDAENQPPSSKPPSTKRQQTALETVTKTPTISPSKRNVIAGDRLPRDAWRSIDLEGVFVPSPSYAHLAATDGFSIETIIQNLTTAEKDMTVEGWIKQNAEQAEERLRQECERMIGKFEDEGNRALNAMESIECA